MPRAPVLPGLPAALYLMFGGQPSHHFYGTLSHSTGESVRDVLPACPDCKQRANQQFQ